MAQMLQLNDRNFDEQIKGAELPVIVDFWAEWCGPCKMIAPILEEIAQEKEGKLIVGKLNVDEALQVARRYEI
jgi:thioredoxin 1